MNKTIIIAEAGINHNGDLNLAVELIKVAATAGADYVKFQTFITELNISKNAPKANYQLNSTGKTESQFEMVKKLELSFDDFRFLKSKCDELKIGFLSTAFDLPSIDFIDSLNPDYFKIPSGELLNKPYIKQIASKQRKIILSTGMAKLKEIKWAVELLEKEGIKKEDISILHCNTEYPTPMKDVNLLAMSTIRKSLKTNIGYSDHTLGIEIPIAAVALGARIIEKHFTLNRNMSGPDHLASLEPSELKQMIQSIRNIELAISGNSKKEPSYSEQKNIAIARKSIHLNTDLKKGDIIRLNDLIILRPGDGISPQFIDKVIGKEVKLDISKGTKLNWKLIK